MISGLHVWFPENQALRFGCNAFLDTGSKNRCEYTFAPVLQFGPNPGRVLKKPCLLAPQAFDTPLTLCRI